MKKRGIRIFCVTVFAIALVTLAGKGMPEKEIPGAIVNSDMQSIEGMTEVIQDTEATEQENAFDQYQALNTNLLGSEFLNDAEEESMINQALVYAKEVQENFLPEFCEKSGFPEDLVVKLEEILDRSGSEGILDAILSDESGELGLQDFRVIDNDGLNILFPKADLTVVADEEPSDKYEWISRFYDIPEDTHMIEHIELLPGKDNYVFRYFDSGLRKNRTRVMERFGDDFVTLYEFELPKTSFGYGVMQYEDKFYYVAHDNDHDVREDEKLVVYRLDYDSLGDGMSIQYKQTQYIWKECPFDADSMEVQPFIEDGYLDQVIQDFSTGRYLYEGGRGDITEIYYGDEELAFEWTSGRNTYQIYKMEIANSSLPVYMCKKMRLTENSELERKYLAVYFLYFDFKSGFFQQQEELSIPEACLIQMWFKEMDGKVYAFRIYNLSDYNYMMSIAQVDGSTVRPLKRYFLLPRKNILEAKKAVYLDEEAAETEVRMVRGDSSPKSEEKEKQYSLEEVEDGYELTLYDKEGREVYSEWCPLNRSWINELTPDVLEIGVSVGSPAHYIEFFDKETAEFSPTYFNPIMVGDKYIAFMEEDGILVLCDLFQRGELYMEIRRDFTGFANRIGAITNINLLDDKHVEIEYYKGEYENEEYTKTKEVITLE